MVPVLLNVGSTLGLCENPELGNSRDAIDNIDFMVYHSINFHGIFITDYLSAILQIFRYVRGGCFI